MARICNTMESQKREIKIKLSKARYVDLREHKTVGNLENFECNFLRKKGGVIS